MSLDEAFARVIGEKEVSLLRPTASQLSAIIKEYGYIAVYAFPSLDASIASSLAASIFERFNVEHVVYFTPVPPRELEEPSLLVGYPAVVVEQLKPRRPAALVGVGERPQGILQVPVTSSTDTSVAGLMAGVLSELTVVGYLAVYAIASAIWRGLDRGKKGEIEGLEASLIEVLTLENIVEAFFTLRLARWKELPTEEALSSTVLPLLPGLSGNPDAARRFLEGDPRLKPLLGKTSDEAPDEAVVVLGEKLYDLLKQRSRVPRRPTEVIGFNYYSRRAPLPDLREAAAVLACYASDAGLGRVYSLLHAEQHVASDAYTHYMRSFDGLAASVVQLLEAGLQQGPRLAGVQTLRIPQRGCGLLLANELRRLGVVHPEALPLLETPEGLLVPLEFAVDRIGFSQLSELVGRGCLEYLEGTPYARLHEARC
ncbi:MAG: hypothetical protein GXO15_05070 [Crenarchaeota archaeon]|nr:hypothetical protein [Thermoproteota archaeon]